MGIREVSIDEYQASEEEWTISDGTEIDYYGLQQIANEVWGFGLEVEVVNYEANSDTLTWRIVAVKSDLTCNEPDCKSTDLDGIGNCIDHGK